MRPKFQFLWPWVSHKSPPATGGLWGDGVLSRPQFATALAGNPLSIKADTGVTATRRHAVTTTISMSAKACAIRPAPFRLSFSRAGFTFWSTAVTGLYHAAMEQASIFAMGSVIRRARCRGGFGKAACAMNVEMAITYCDSV